MLQVGGIVAILAGHRSGTPFDSVEFRRCSDMLSRVGGNVGLRSSMLLISLVQLCMNALVQFDTLLNRAGCPRMTRQYYVRVC